MPVSQTVALPLTIPVPSGGTVTSKTLDDPSWTFDQFSEAMAYLGGMVYESEDSGMVVLTFSPRLAKLMKRGARSTFAGREMIPTGLILSVMDRQYHAEHGHPRPKPVQPASCRRCWSKGLDVPATHDYLGAPVCVLCRLWIYGQAAPTSVVDDRPVAVDTCVHCYGEMTSVSREAVAEQIESYGTSLHLCWRCWTSHSVHLDDAGNVI